MQVQIAAVGEMGQNTGVATGFRVCAAGLVEVVAVPNAAPDLNILVSVFQVRVGNQETVLIFAGSRAEHDPGVGIRLNVTPGGKPQAALNPIGPRRNEQWACTGVQGLLKDGKVIMEAISGGTALFNVDCRTGRCLCPGNHTGPYIEVGMLDLTFTLFSRSDK
jgi:hypothetical protein